VIALGYVFLASDAGLLKIWLLRRELARERAAVVALGEKKEALLAEKAAMENDLDYLEKIAREEYNMAGPEELIYRFEEDSSAAPSPAGKGASSGSPAAKPPAGKRPARDLDRGRAGR
jgi:cell division protein FtsB